MNRSKQPILAGMLIFLLLGMVGLYFVFRSDPGKGREVRSNGTSVDVSDADSRPSGQGNPRGGNQAETETPRPEVAGQPEVVAPKRASIAGRISGVVVDSEDEPIAASRVQLLAEKDASLNGPSATTDEKGSFAFEVNLEEGVEHFVASISEDYAIAASGVFSLSAAKPAVDNIKLKLFRPARVYGVVLSGDDQTPLADAAIEFSAPRMSPQEDRIARLLGRLKPVKSDEQGRYDVTLIPPGNYTVKAVKQGWISNEFNPLTRDSQTTELAEYAQVELLPFILIQAGIVEGRVIRKGDKQPVAGASVELTTALGGSFGSTVTDTEGKYRFENAPPSAIGNRRRGQGMPGGPGGQGGPGGIEVRALAENYAVASVGVAPVAGEVVKARDIELEDGCTVKGRVIDIKGQGIAGARVYYNNNDFVQGGEMVVGLALPPRAVSTTTESDGSFLLKHIPPSNDRRPSRIICASAIGYCNGETAAPMVPGQVAEVVITLAPGGIIAGKVTDEFGEPVAGVPIAAYEAGGPRELNFIMNSFFGEELPDRGSNSIVPPSVRSAEDGSYRLEGLKAKKYFVVANSRNHEKHISKEIEVKAGETVEYNMVLVNGGTVYGRVFDAQEKGVPGVAVTVAKIGEDGIAVRTTYTDRNGAYEISGLAEGTYTVRRFDGDLSSFAIPNPATSVPIKRGERTRFDIYDQRPGTARIYGRVRVDGQPYKEKGLVLYGQGRRGTAVNQTTTDDQGSYEFRSVPLGSYQIAQKTEGVPFPLPNLVRRTVRVDKAGDLEVNIDFVTVTISGTVTLDGGGIPEGTVRVWINPVNAQNDDGEETEPKDGQISPIEEIVGTRAECDKKTGAFEIKGLSPGAYKITVRSDRYGMLIKPYVNAQASITGLQLVLPRENATLKGTVKGIDGAKPTFPNTLLAVVTIEDSKGKQITLGENGVANLFDKKEFEIKNLPPGTYNVILSITNYAPCRVHGVSFKAGETTPVEFNVIASGNAKIIVQNKDLNLDEAYQLTYEIKDSTGALYKKPFTFLDFFNPDGSMAQNPDENSFIIKDLPQDSYTITFKHPDYEDATASFVVITGQTVDVPVTFRKK